jgi:hypothetical protein
MFANLSVFPTRIGYPTLRISLRGAVRWREKRVTTCRCSRIGVDLVMVVTDMFAGFLTLAARRNLKTSTKEIMLQPSHRDDSVERRNVIRNKILAVGRMARKLHASLRFFGS